MSTCNLLQKLIDYATISNANIIDIDQVDGVLDIRIIDKQVDQHFTINPREQNDFIDNLMHFCSERRKQLINNTSFIYSSEIYKKENGIRYIINISKNNFRQIPINKIGFKDKELNLIEENIFIPDKINLLIGEAGSGLTTTLYSLLNYLNSPYKDIYSVEKHIEDELDGIHQILSTSYNKSIVSIFLREKPNFISLDTPEIILLKKSTDLVEQGIPVTISINANNITNAFVGLINNGINPKMLANYLNLVAFQHIKDGRRCFKLFKINTITKNTLRHPRLTRSLLKKTINQNLF
ncbi:Flp pilus assembly complex ATPase component TadA [Patescibacteria group bacterium]|nr:Flp pilus assembly complex ATPase component TadA [Patescibacteria group bacterium]